MRRGGRLLPGPIQTFLDERYGLSNNLSSSKPHRRPKLHFSLQVLSYLAIEYQASNCRKQAFPDVWLTTSTRERCFP